MKEWYKARKEKVNLQGKLTFERVRTTSDWPKLKAKAAATRHLVHYAVDLCERHNSGSEHDKRRLVCCKFLAYFYTQCATHGRWFPQNVLDRLSTGVRVFMGCYMNLSREAVGKQTRAWKMTPKFHFFVHLCDLQAPMWGNPRFYWTYADEDLQRVMKGIAIACHTMNMAPRVIFKLLCMKFD